MQTQPTDKEEAFKNYDCTEGNSFYETDKQKIIRKLIEHSKEKAWGKHRKIAKELCWDYNKRGDYIRKVASGWKYDLRNGQGSRNAIRSKPDSQHHVFAVCRVPDCLDRKRFSDVSDLAVAAGWRLSRNRNHVLIWDSEPSLGRVQWFTSGLVMVHANKTAFITVPALMAKVKTLLWHCFVETCLIEKVKIVNPFLASVQWNQHHDAYDTDGHRLPYLKIETYKETHGFVFKSGDASDPTKFEFEFVKIPYVESLERIAETATKTLSAVSQVLQNKAVTDDRLAPLIEQLNTTLQDLSAPKGVKGDRDRRRLYE